MRWLACLLLILSQVASAEVLPHPGPGDPHIQYVAYDADQVVVLNAALGFAITVELSPDERVENLAIGNGTAWQVQTNHRSDKVFVKPLIGGVPTNMTVITDVRRYSFVLRSNGSDDLSSPYAVRFTYPGAGVAQRAEAAVEQTGHFRFSGKRALWPIAMSDDGQFTAIAWQPDATMPAVYKVNDQDQEVLVNGTVRDGAYIIEGVATKFVFRLGKAASRATRVAIKERR